MDTNEQVTPDGPIVGDVAAVIRDVLFYQTPVVLAIGMYVEDEAIANALVEALADVVNILHANALAGEYAVKRDYDAWSKEDLAECDLLFG